MDRTRRALIGGMIAAVLPLPRALSAAPGLYVSARGGRDGRFAASLLSAAGEVVMDIPLPARGHGGAVRPRGAEAVLFARRPGGFALVVDIAGRRVAGWLHPPKGRSFTGHGVYSRDGQTLYAVEFEAATGDGVVAVHDVAGGYRRTGEFPSGGIGPHQAVLLPDAGTLAVCNGGIRTHPDFPRAKLNIATMRSSLVLIDGGSGRITETLGLAGLDHRLGLRHLDAAPDGRVVLGMQYEGPRSHRVPLVALYRPGRGLAPLAAPRPVEAALRRYIGSVAFDAGGDWIAATSPRGGAIAVWRAADGASAGLRRFDDVCGIAPAAGPGRFIVTSGRGAEAILDAPTMTLSRLPAASPGFRWDNHLVAVNRRAGR
jgi:hypothetical protein